MSHLHQGSSWEQEEEHVQTQDSQSDRRDVVQAHLKHLGGQEQQAQVGSPLSLHPENSLGGDAAKIKITDLSRNTSIKPRFLDVNDGRFMCY